MFYHLFVQTPFLCLNSIDPGRVFPPSARRSRTRFHVILQDWKTSPCFSWLVGAVISLANIDFYEGKTMSEPVDTVDASVAPEGSNQWLVVCEDDEDVEEFRIMNSIPCTCKEHGNNPAGLEFVETHGLAFGIVAASVGWNGGLKLVHYGGEDNDEWHAAILGPLDLHAATAVQNAVREEGLQRCSVMLHEMPEPVAQPGE